MDARDREIRIQKLTESIVDLIVIGGGITGAGIALDATLRGLKVALVEKGDYASGTSSKSTKLIHGGLRYLKQMEFALVKEVGSERAIVHNLAPHLVIPEKMLLPLNQGGSYGYWLTAIGLMLYDILAGVRKEERRVMLNTRQTRKREPLLKGNRLLGSGYYTEYRTDDARLTLSLLKTANSLGAQLLNYTEVQDFLVDKGQIVGVKCADTLVEGKNWEIKGKVVVSAAGPWVDIVRTKQEQITGKKLHLTKGVHLVLRHSRFPVQQSIYFDVPDGRMVFAIPRENCTYLGTTDTTFSEDPDNILVSLKDVEYLLNAANNMFPELNLTKNDILSSWAGLRPLIEESGKSASDISRKDEIFISESGLISIAGGKLTGYRKMASRVTDLAEQRIHGKVSPCKTDTYKLAGGIFQSSEEVQHYRKKIDKWLSTYQLSEYWPNYLVSRYGIDTDKILAYLTNKEVTNQSLLEAELDYVVENEDAHTLSDFFDRRTARIYFYTEDLPHQIEIIASRLANIFNWSQEEKQLKIDSFKTKLKLNLYFK